VTRRLFKIRTAPSLFLPPFYVSVASNV